MAELSRDEIEAEADRMVANNKRRLSTKPRPVAIDRRLLRPYLKTMVFEGLPDTEIIVRCMVGLADMNLAPPFAGMLADLAEYRAMYITGLHDAAIRRIVEQHISTSSP